LDWKGVFGTELRLSLVFLGKGQGKDWEGLTKELWAGIIFPFFLGLIGVGYTDW